MVRLLLTLVAFATSVRAAPIERVSISSAGEQANGGGSTGPALSADGRFIAFHSNASNLVANDTNGDLRDETGGPLSTADVFVRDRLTCTTERVSVTSDGLEADGTSAFAALSSDGRFVVFQSNAGTLNVQDQSFRVRNIYLHDRETGETQLVSTGMNNEAANGYSWFPDISGDGNLVAFISQATNLVANGGNPSGDVYLYNRLNDTLVRPNLVGGDGYPDEPVGAVKITRDGQSLVLWTSATNLAGLDPGSIYGDVYRHVIGTEETTRLSGPGGGDAPLDVSGDGCVVLFRTPNYPHTPAVRYDCVTNSRMLFDVPASALASEKPSIVALVGAGDRIPNHQTGSAYGVFLVDTDAGSSERVSVTPDGEPVPLGKYTVFGAVALSATGEVIAFMSNASGLVSGSTVPNLQEVYVRDSSSELPMTASCMVAAARASASCSVPGVVSKALGLAHEWLALADGGSGEVGDRDRYLGKANRLLRKATRKIRRWKHRVDDPEELACIEDLAGKVKAAKDATAGTGVSSQAIHVAVKQ